MRIHVQIFLIIFCLSMSGCVAHRNTVAGVDTQFELNTAADVFAAGLKNITEKYIEPVKLLLYQQILMYVDM